MPGRRREPGGRAVVRRWRRAAIVLYRNGTVTTLSWPGAASLLLANETAF